MDLTQSVTQTIEGTFVGYTSEREATEFLQTAWSLSQFKTSPAEIAFVAVDGSWFDVYLRNRVYLDRLVQRVANVHWQDPAEFLE